MSLEKITTNGEITFDTETGLYTVWDEVYCDPICTTDNLEKSVRVLESYCKQLERRRKCK